MARYVDNYHKAHGLILGDWIGCAICNKTSDWIHHIIYRSQGGSDEAANLIALCDYHHKCSHFLAEPYLTKEELYDLQ